MRKRPTATIVTGVVAVAIIVGQLATTAAATNGPTGPWLPHRHVVWDIPRRLPRDVHPALDTVEVTVDRDDQALEQRREDEHHGHRAGQDHPFRNRRQHKCDHVLGLGIRNVDVGHLQGRWRRRLVERAQDVIPAGRTRESPTRSTARRGLARAGRASGSRACGTHGRDSPRRSCASQKPRPRSHRSSTRSRRGARSEARSA